MQFKRIMLAAAMALAVFHPSFASEATALQDASLANENKEEILLSHLKNESEVLVLIFVSANCPVTTLYWSRLKGTWYNFREQGVHMAFVAGNSDDQPDLIRGKVKEMDLDLPLLWDAKHTVAKKLQVDHTPIAVVIGRNWQVCYRGLIDNSWRDETRVTQHFLNDAITAALANKKSADQMGALFLGSAMR